MSHLSPITSAATLQLGRFSAVFLPSPPSIFSLSVFPLSVFLLLFGTLKFLQSSCQALHASRVQLVFHAVCSQHTVHSTTGTSDAVYVVMLSFRLAKRVNNVILWGWLGIKSNFRLVKITGFFFFFLSVKHKKLNVTYPHLSTMLFFFSGQFYNWACLSWRALPGQMKRYNSRRTLRECNWVN